MTPRREVFRGTDGRLYWRLFTEDDGIVAIGGEGFPTRDDAKVQFEKAAAAFAEFEVTPPPPPPPPPPPNEPPVAVLEVTPAGGDAPLTVHAAGVASTDPDGFIASYSIDFGDGTVVDDQEADHVYATAGAYVVTLTVTDDAGATAVISDSVSVSEPPPPPPPPPPSEKPMLGTGATVQSDGLPWRASGDLVEPEDHIYAGPQPGAVKVVHWNRPTPLPAASGLINIRWRAKDTIALHAKAGAGATCSACGRPTADLIHRSIFASALAGEMDWMLDAVAAELMKLDRTVYATLHHEFMQAAELFPGEASSLWGDAFVYGIDYLAAAGVDNVLWTSCPFGSQYASGVAATMHTPALLERLFAVGADIYFTPTDIGSGAVDLRAQRAWAAFADSYPDKPKIILEAGLWNGTEAQQVAWLEAVRDWYADNPDWIAFFGFFRNDVGAGHNGALFVPNGVAKWEELVADDLFDRSTQ